MNKFRILTAMVLAVGGLSLAACQQDTTGRDGMGAQGEENGIGIGAEENDRGVGTEQTAPGSEERTGFGQGEEQQPENDPTLRQRGEDAANDAENTWNEDIRQPVEREFNE